MALATPVSVACLTEPGVTVPVPTPVVKAAFSAQLMVKPVTVEAALSAHVRLIERGPDPLPEATARRLVGVAGIAGTVIDTLSDHGE